MASNDTRERERTRRLFGLLALAIVLVIAIVVLYLVGDGNASVLSVAARLEGFLTAVVAGAAIDLARRDPDSPPAPHRPRLDSDPPSDPPPPRVDREDTTARRIRIQRDGRGGPGRSGP